MASSVAPAPDVVDDSVVIATHLDIPSMQPLLIVEPNDTNDVAPVEWMKESEENLQETWASMPYSEREIIREQIRAFQISPMVRNKPRLIRENQSLSLEWTNPPAHVKNKPWHRHQMYLKFKQKRGRKRNGDETISGFPVRVSKRPKQSSSKTDVVDVMGNELVGSDMSKASGKNRWKPPCKCTGDPTKSERLRTKASGHRLIDLEAAHRMLDGWDSQSQLLQAARRNAIQAAIHVHWANLLYSKISGAASGMVLAHFDGSSGKRLSKKRANNGLNDPEQQQITLLGDPVYTDSCSSRIERCMQQFTNPTAAEDPLTAHDLNRFRFFGNSSELFANRINWEEEPNHRATQEHIPNPIHHHQVHL